MRVKETIREWIFKDYSRQHLFYLRRINKEKKAINTISDYDYITSEYEKRYHKRINLSNPQTYSEKLQWLKLFYRNDDMPICTDKYRIREYVSKKGLYGLCNELIGVYDNAYSIDFEKLPNSFVIKANHGSGWNIICKEKSNIDWKGCKKVMNDWLKMNLFVFGREWNYNEIEPKLVVESFIDHEPLYDYKLMCFNGIPRYVQLNNDFEGEHYVDFYDISTWDHLPITYTNFKKSKREIDRPFMMDKMIEIAKVLSEPFPFVRVDFYSYDKTIILGEMTFFPSSGLWPIIPAEYGYEEKLGRQLILPTPNHNIELLNEIELEMLN